MTPPNGSTTHPERSGDLIDEDTHLTGPVCCPNRLRHLTSSKRSATLWVGSEDCVGRNFDPSEAVIDCNRAVVERSGEVDRPFECGALTSTEESVTYSVGSDVLIREVARANGEVDDHLTGRD
jgi:hypothetical protein